MDPQSHQGSPFIKGMGVVPPSPDHNHRSTELDSSFDVGSPNFIDASGSFNNSPYSNHSELSFVTAEGDLGGSGYDIFVEHSDPQGLFDVLPSSGISAGTDYDPADYDGPSSASSLLMFGSDQDYYHHGMASPDLQGHHRQGSVPFDHSSPSSNGDAQDRRSRGSSISSAYQGQNQQPSAHFGHSPRLDVAHSFENMTVRSPNWGHEGLPSQPKPQSPPRLMMPENYGMENQELPTINAPEGDGGVGGPQLHIVPATPIGTIETSAPFGNALRQGSDQQSNWQGVPSESNSRQHSPYRIPVQLEPTASQDSNFSNASSEFLFPQQRTRTNSGNAAWDQGMQHQQQQHQSGLGLDLDPNMNHGNLDDGVLGSGSSTTSMQPNSGGSPSFSMQNFTFGGPSTANRDSSAYLSPNDPFAMRRSKSDQPSTRHLGHRQSRSEDVRGNALFNAQQQQQQQIAVAQHAAQQQQAGWAQGPQQSFAAGGNTGGTHSHPHSPYHGHSLSLSASSGQMLFPPNNNDFAAPVDNNLLTPAHRNQRSLGGQGHIRRASSGSRSERGVGSDPWLTAYSGGSARASPYPSPNASPRVPYNAELELDLEREDRIEIPAAGNSAGFENEVSLTGRVGPGAGAGGAGLAGLLGPGGVGGHATHSPKSIDVNDFLGNASVSALHTISATSMSLGLGHGMGMGHGHHGSVDHKPPSVNQVSKPNVTTLRTANASHKRRKQEAGFVCPFPGCGSTFTRSFNLKGHIRSHNEEKPFVCHWPGCGKGFARQHDCKRHEQLHTNYRPFTCDGCNRQFARMDALNRHLRSDGGAECAKLQQGSSQQGTPDPSNPSNSDRATPATTASPSPRPSNQSLMSSPRLDGGGMGVDTWGVTAQAIGVSL